MYESNISVFTREARATFVSTYSSTADAPEVANIMVRVDSKGAVENHAWLSPTPGIAKYDGVRRLGNIKTVIYPIANDTFDGAFQVPKENADDDQLGGFLKKSEELAIKAKLFAGRRVLWQLSQGRAAYCFDKSYFFADSHNEGTGDNNISVTNATNDGTTHYIAALIVDSPVKPLIWQDREAPVLDTDSGTPQARYARQYRYWADLRGGTGFGYWWDALFVTVTYTPTAQEFMGIIGKIKTQFRGFQLPQFNTDTPAEYVHEQKVFTDKNLVLVVSTGLEDVANLVNRAEVIAQTTNVYKNQFSVITSAFMNSPA